MHSSLLAILGGLSLCIGCTSESAPVPSPKVDSSSSKSDATKSKTQAPASVQATTATWIVYEMPG